MKLNPYLHFAGNAEEVANFYKDALDGEILMLNRFGDSPVPCDEDWKQKIMHVRIKFGDDNIIMISDRMKGEAIITNGNIDLSIGLDDEAKTQELFNKLSAGGTAIMPPAKQFWGDVFGMLKDKFGVTWMLNCTVKK